MILKLSNSITKSSKTSGAVSTEKGFLITRNARTATKWVFNNIKMKICFFFGIFLVQLFLWFALLFGLFSVWVLIKMFSSTKILITHAIKGFHRISTRLFTKNYDGARNIFAIRGLSKFRPEQSWVDGLGNYAVPWTLRCHFALNNQLTGLAVVNWVKYKGLRIKSHSGKLHSSVALWSCSVNILKLNCLHTLPGGNYGRVLDSCLRFTCLKITLKFSALRIFITLAFRVSNLCVNISMSMARIRAKFGFGSRKTREHCIRKPRKPINWDSAVPDRIRDPIHSFQSRSSGQSSGIRILSVD